jgi:hypothetical protein
MIYLGITIVGMLLADEFLKVHNLVEQAEIAIRDELRIIK